jgi:hypothetical protein
MISRADDLRCEVERQRCRDRRVLREDGGFDWLPCGPGFDTDAGSFEDFVCAPCAIYRALASDEPMSERKARAVGVLVEQLELDYCVAAAAASAANSWMLDECLDALEAIAELLRGENR